MKPYVPELKLRFYDVRFNTFVHPSNADLSFDTSPLPDPISNISAFAHISNFRNKADLLILVPWSGHTAKNGTLVFHGDLVKLAGDRSAGIYVCFVRPQNIKFLNVVTGTVRLLNPGNTSYYTVLGSALLSPERISHAETRALFEFHQNTENDGSERSN